MTSWSGGRASAMSGDEITQRRAVILTVRDNRCRGLRHTKKTDLNHQQLELSSAATILVCCARRRLARIAFCPSIAPVRWEHCLHSGRRLDSELIMSSVQPSSFALCLSSRAASPYACPAEQLRLMPVQPSSFALCLSSRAASPYACPAEQLRL